MTFLDDIKREFSVEEVDIRTYSPLTLAFIGDCVFDMVIRTVVVGRANQATDKLHKKKANIVKAKTQADMIHALLDDLTEEELGYYKRGRNAHSYSSAKNATVGDYRKATGFEALLGFLYLTNQEGRILELTKLGLERLEIEI